MPEIERRKFPRLGLNVEVKYKLLEQGGAETLTTQSKNISVLGIRIILLDKLDIGAPLELNFLLPDPNQVITATGKVSWIQEFIVGDPKTGMAYDAGIEFINITDKDRKKIYEYVSERV